MCGIVSVINKGKMGFTQTQVQLFTNLLYCDAVRGFDSTGFFEVNKFGNVKWMKSRGTPPIVLANKDYAEMAKESIQTGQILVGHNRKATLGNITDENAHPFIEKNIILVHNGTISGHKKHADTEVDSHAICKIIQEKGYKEAIKSIDGAFTLVWYNILEKKLYCVRNDKRPMSILETNSSFILSSEAKLAEWLIDRESYNNKIVENTECKPGTCYTWEVDNCSSFKEETLELFTFPPFLGTTQNFGGVVSGVFQRRNSDTSTKKNKKLQKALHGAVEENFKKGETISFELLNYDDHDSPNWAGILEGETHKGSPFTVKALFTDATWEAIYESNRCRGRISSINLAATPPTIWLYPESVEPDEDLKDVNGSEISFEVWNNIDHKCWKCDAQVEYKRIPDSIVHIKGTNKSKVICPDCVEILIANRTKKINTPTKEQQVALLH